MATSIVRYSGGDMKLLLVAMLAIMPTSGCSRSREIDADPALEVEIVAIRNVLSQYRPSIVTVDQGYVQPGHAPPSGTGQRRPAQRQQTLADSIKQDATDPRGDTLRIRASVPEVRGQTATIHVTVDGRLAGGHPGAFYETVSLALERIGSRWVVRKRTQLGIS